MERCAAGSVPTVTNGKKKTQNILLDRPCQIGDLVL